MTILREGQYKIGDLLMGPGTPIKISDFAPGGYEVNNMDQKVSFSDEVTFGFDSLTPSPMSFELAIIDNFDIWRGPEHLVPGYPSGAEMVEQLTAEWRADAQRKVWNSVKPLEYKKNGPQKIVFGRPRKITVIKTRLGGEFIPAVLDFQPADPLTYGAIENVQDVAPSVGGATTISINRTGGGRAPTWFRGLITGPINKPKIYVGGQWVAEIDVNLAAGKVLEVNSYPWQRRIVDSDSNSHSAKLLGDVYMDEMKIPPLTTTTVGLSGASGTTSATKLSVFWREAYYSY